MRSRPWQLWPLASCLVVAAASAQAACSRVMVMPIGQSVLSSQPAASAALAPALPESRLHQRVREAGAALGCEFSFPLVPRPRVHAMLLNGEADLMMPAARDRERDEMARFVPMTEVRPALVMRRGDPRRPVSFEALVANKRLGGLMVRGQSWGGSLDRALKDQPERLQRVSDLATVVRMLAAGRADFSITEPALLRGLARRPDLRAQVAQLEVLPLAGLPAVEAGAYVSRYLPGPDQVLMMRMLASAPVRELMQPFEQRAAPPPVPRRR